MPRSGEARVLVARGVDGLLVGWLAVLVWIGVRVGGGLGVSKGSLDLGLISSIGLVVTAAHFGLSYHLAYGRGVAAAVRQRPWALLVLPLLVVAALAGLVVASLVLGEHAVARTTSGFVTSVYLLTTWHYVKQVYGVGRVGAAFAGIALSTREAQVLRYALYPTWFLGAAQVLVEHQQYYFGGFPVGYHLLSGSAYSALRVLALVSAAPLLVVLGRIWARSGRLPSLVVAPYAAAVLWLAVPTNPVLTVLLLAPFHALQYLAIAHRATVAVAVDRPGHHGVGWWVNIVAGAACGGLLFSRWVPQFLDRHLDPTGAPLLFTAAFFVFLNLHHYLIDASIWRSKGELVRAIGRSPGRRRGVPAAATAPIPAPVSR